MADTRHLTSWDIQEYPIWWVSTVYIFVFLDKPRQNYPYLPICMKEISEASYIKDNIHQHKMDNVQILGDVSLVPQCKLQLTALVTLNTTWRFVLLTCGSHTLYLLVFMTNPITESLHNYVDSLWKLRIFFSTCMKRHSPHLLCGFWWIC